MARVFLDFFFPAWIPFYGFGVEVSHSSSYSWVFQTLGEITFWYTQRQHNYSTTVILRLDPDEHLYRLLCNLRRSLPIHRYFKIMVP